MAKVTAIAIPAIKMDTIEVPIVGKTPLISQAWDPLEIARIIAGQTGKAKSPKAARDPEREYEATKYKLPDGRCGMPVSAFKKSMVRAGKAVGLVMTDARGIFFVEGEGDPTEPLVPIDGESYMRTDMCTIKGTVMPRFRACFPNWTATVKIMFDLEMISVEQVVALLNRAGETVGIGGWRPEKNGNFGRFNVAAE